MNNKTKRVFSLLVCAALIAVVIPIAALATAEHTVRDGEIWDGSVASAFAGGSGTESDPYRISNGAELAFLAEQVNAGESYYGCFFELTDDIYLNDTEGWEDWSSENPPANTWTPIGWSEYCTDENGGSWHEMRSFEGNFNGGEHAIYGLFACPEDDSLITKGLFGCMYNGTVSDLMVLDSHIIGNYTCSGIVAWGAEVRVNDCAFRGWIESGAYCGGIIGYMEGDSISICDCMSVGIFEGSEATGAILGYFCGHSTAAEMLNCKANGIVCSEKEAGGIAGWFEGYAECCMAAGRVIGGEYAGGLFGSLWISVRKSYSLADVTGACAGGIAGVANSAGINDSYNCGAVDGAQIAGGLVGMGYEFALYQCYNIGSVTGGEVSGAVFGYDYEGYCTCENCFCLEGCTEGQHIGAIVLTEEQMADGSNYEEYDFDNVWTMEGNPDYPYAELIDNPHLTIENEEPAIPGDVNGSGAVDVADAVIVMRASMGLIELTEQEFAAGDINGDGQINITDAVTLLRMAMGIA
ncbi:MAG: dockerin type I repeat-containing protein [Clostridia bacterium]|nr:dockerin type I repeat-containing protein [Clostridia bacterium]